jgi:hypothetical protein
MYIFQNLFVEDPFYIFQSDFSNYLQVGLVSIYFWCLKRINFN